MELPSKRKLLLPFVFVLLAPYASGCSPRTDDFKRASMVDTYMDSWVGHYQSELTAWWGPPTKVEPDGKGGNMLIYESLKGTWGDAKDKRIVGGIHYPTGPTQEGYAATRVFYVNQNGIVYSWKWSGL